MADNYIERKMEDMRAGRLASASSTGAKVRQRKGMVEFPFPSRRVLIAGAVSGKGLEIAKAFLKAGCRVAVFDNDKEGGRKLAYKEGVRFHCLNLAVENEVSKAFACLVDAWRDVDIVVTTSDENCSEVIAGCWACHRERYPVPFGYAGRMITISSRSNLTFANVKTLLSRHRMTVNNIVLSDTPTGEPRDIARLCLILSLPGNDFIDGLRIDC